MKNIYLQLHDHKLDNPSLVLCTVTRTHGSTPQKPGSSAIFDNNGLIAGTVGGGVVEGKVQRLAIEAYKSKSSGHFQFNLSNDISNKEEAICGGQIEILIDASLNNHFPVFEQIRKSIKDHVPGVLLTKVTGLPEEKVLINRYWISNTFKPDMPVEFLEKIEPVIQNMLSKGDPSDYREMELSITNAEATTLFFLEPVFPPAHLVIAGAGHIGKALAHLANLLDFEVTVIDDRPEYANAENIPEADHILVNDIGESIKGLMKNKDTYVVIVTHGHKDDAAALKPCIGADLAYTGMIGSKTKIASMRASFMENKWATAKQWDAIHAPLGIDIKSGTVEEIAISIAAELVLVRNGRRSK